jgi:signal transduction histidine kinase
MKKRLIVLFVSILIIPLGLAFLLGLGSLRDAQDATLNRYRTFLESRLGAIREEIDKLTLDWDNQFLELTAGTDRSVDALREQSRQNPLVRQAFLLDPQGDLLFPDGEIASNQELAFLERTASLWERGMAFSLSEEGVQRTYGWRKWYWQEGDQYFFWHKVEDGSILGLEIDRYGLLAELIAVLPNEPWQREERDQHSIVLKDMQERVFFQWGGYQAEESPAVVLPLNEPFGGWELTYAISADALPVENSLGLLALLFGAVAVGVVLTFLGYYFITQVSRSMVEAGQRINFVNQVSHELKTPLTNIRLYSELLEGKLVQPEAKVAKYLGVIKNETQRLSRLIHNVLTFGGKQKEVQLRPQLAVVDDCVRKVVQSFLPSLEKLGFDLVEKYNAVVPLHFDADILEQILGNLISNAEKYAKDGAYLEIETALQDHQILITVCDRGPGVPKKHRKKIFYAFERLHNKLTDGAGGTGIGLTIAKELSQAHGGDLVLLEAEQGAKFQIQLQSIDSNSKDQKGESAV